MAGRDALERLSIADCSASPSGEFHSNPKCVDSQSRTQLEIFGGQRYTSDKLTPHFSEDFSSVSFSFERGNQQPEPHIKISKGEESNFIWSVFNALLEQVIAELNIPEVADRSTDVFNNLAYVFVDDPVSSLDENHLIELAVNLAGLIKSSQTLASTPWRRHRYPCARSSRSHVRAPALGRELQAAWLGAKPTHRCDCHEQRPQWGVTDGQWSSGDG